MLLPISDEPNPKEFRPWVTYGLIALNVLIFLFWTWPLSGQAVDAGSQGLAEYLTWLDQQVGLVVEPYTMPDLIEEIGIGEVSRGLEENGLLITGWDLVVFQHGYRPSDPQFMDLFTSMFMHAGFMHLLGNMVFLWVYGDNVEHRLGRIGFLVSYLLTGIAATLAFALVAGNSGTPLVGASGAISGVLGLYFLLFPANRVRVLVFLGWFITTIMLPARIVLGIYVVIDNILPLVVESESNVAYGAHLGGFIAGLVIARLALFRSPQPARSSAASRAPVPRPRPQSRPQVLDFQTGNAILDAAGDNRSPEPDLARAIEAAIDARDPDRAIFQFLNSRAQDHELLSSESTAVLAEWLATRNLAPQASKIVRRRIRIESGRTRARLLLALARVRKAQGNSISAHQSMLDALENEPDYKLELEIRAELQQISN